MVSLFSIVVKNTKKLFVSKNIICIFVLPKNTECTNQKTKVYE